jgi:hypothetical protein
MNLLCLSFPGQLLKLTDKAASRYAQGLVTVIEHTFLDAVASLSLYQAARTNSAVSRHRTGASPAGPCPSCGAQRLPSHLEQHLPFLHAQSFLYALDTIGKVLTVLAKYPSIPDAVRNQENTFRESLPSLTSLRDTAHHPEDRARGLKKSGKRIKLKPVENAFLHFSEGGVLVLGNFIGDKYGSTTADGRYAEIEVSIATLTTVHACLQATINALPWH